MEKYYDILGKCLLFQGIARDNLITMLGCLGGKVEHFQKGTTLMAEGDPAKYIGIVLVGTVQVIRIDYYGNRSIVTTVEKTQVFGESFACAGIEEMPVDVVASEDVKVLLLDCRRIIRSCSNSCDFHSRVIYNLMKVVATKNLVFHQKLEIISKRTTREKLMAYLMMQAKKCGSNSFRIPYDRQELADFLEVDRSGLSAEIGKLCREGLIENRKNDFKLL